MENEDSLLRLVLLIVDGQTYALHLAAVGRVLLMERLGIRDIADLALFAARAGLVERDS